MTGNLVYGILGKTKSANWHKYFADSSEIWSDESKPPDMIWNTEHGTQSKGDHGVKSHITAVSLCSRWLCI